MRFQLLEHRLNRPPPPIQLRDLLPRGGRLRQVGQQEQGLVAAAGRTGEFDPDQAIDADVVRVLARARRHEDFDLLFIHFPGLDRPHEPRRRQRGHRQAFVVAAQECAGAGLDAGQERTDAEIAIHDPEIARLDRRHHLAQQGPFLCVPVFAREDIDRHLHRRVIDHQRLAWQRSRGGGAQHLQAMLRRCNAVPIQDFHPIARQPRATAPLHVLDEVAEVPRGVAHQRPGGLGLHAVELVVHRRDGDRDLPRRPLRLIRGMDTPKGFEDHHTHQLERRREQQLPRILLLGDGLEPVVEAGGLEDAFEQRSQHHRDRKRLAGSAEKRIQYHGTSNRAHRERRSPRRVWRSEVQMSSGFWDWNGASRPTRRPLQTPSEQADRALLWQPQKPS